MLDRGQHRELPAQPLARVVDERGVQHLERDDAPLPHIGRREQRGVGAGAEVPVEPPAAVQHLGRCQLRLHPLRLRAQSWLVKSTDGGMATTSRRSSVMSSIDPADALAAEAGVLDAAVGHVVDAVARRVVDDDATDGDALEGAPGVHRDRA